MSLGYSVCCALDKRGLSVPLKERKDGQVCIVCGDQ
jgi:hypothetical protein